MNEKKMKKYLLTNKKKLNLTLGVLIMVIFTQGLIISKLWSEKDNKLYEVNLVKINTEKDSIDYLKMKSDLQLVDHTIRDINSFLRKKRISNTKIEILKNDSLSNAVYLAKQSNRYSQYLNDLQEKLRQIPLGYPTQGSISSHFGIRKNPIPKTNFASVLPLSYSTKITEEHKSTPLKITELKVTYEKDSTGKLAKKITPIYQKIETSRTSKARNSEVLEKPQISISKKQNGIHEMQNHKGIDFSVPIGNDVISTANGKVIFAGVKGGYGNCIIISHEGGIATLYAHLSQILVEANDIIKSNQIIGKSGNTGRSTGPHLHYEVHKNNTPVNPRLFLDIQ